jgi:hypothetical protein
VSRKHFEAIAQLITDLKDRIGEKERRIIAHELANTLSQFNGMFDRGRFLAACELSKEEQHT